MKRLMSCVIFAFIAFGVLHISTGKSNFFQEIKNIFHYFPEDTDRPKVKEAPVRFEKDIKTQIRYPETKEVK